MTISSMDQLVAGLVAGDTWSWYKNALTTTTGANTGVFASLWTTPGSPGAASTPPTGTGEVPTEATAGALPFTDPGGADSAYLAQCTAGMDDIGNLVVYDRLWHNSGLSGTTTTAQTVNSLTLTRDGNGGSDGDGVEAWMECYTALGATSRTLTVSYTDQDGNAGASGTLTVPASMPAGRMIPVNLAAGDSGVRSIQSVTLSATTGTAGDFGMVLLRRIAEIPIVNSGGGSSKNTFDLGLPRLYANTCLAAMLLCGSSTPGPFTGIYSVAKG